MSKHTPRPWKCKTTPGSDHELCTIYEDRPCGRAVARHVIPENAVLIVRACNAHEELLATCKNLLATMLDMGLDGDEDHFEKINAAKAAIAMAEGTELG